MFGIESLPEEVLEHVLGFVCPYEDYKNCSLVCHLWKRVISGIAQQKQLKFKDAISNGNVHWKRYEQPKKIASISPRYSHNAVYHNGSVYVFGGCSVHLDEHGFPSYTTFNDMWMYDLSSREWKRPCSNGNYPSPKACSSMVVWRDYLILFGGWLQPSRTPMYQPFQFFNQLHYYDTKTSTWNLVDSDRQPDPVAGHSACVLGNLMIIFGGTQNFGSSIDHIWSLDLISKTWTKVNVLSDLDERPAARYGAFMSAVNSYQALMIGGIGGPNTKFSDCYLLTLMTPTTCTWKQLEVRGSQNVSAGSLWCHTMCKVGSEIVTLNRTTLPIPEDVLSRISRYKQQEVGKSVAGRHCHPYASSSSSEDDNFRPALSNQHMKRQKRLEALDKYQKKFQNKSKTLLKHPMFTHIIDVSTVDYGYIVWNEANVTGVSGDVPEDTYFYSLVEGRGELMMFGGVHPDNESTMSNSFRRNESTLCDDVYVIGARP